LKLAPSQFCEHLCLVKTTPNTDFTLTPGREGSDVSMNQLWPALKFNTHKQLMDQLTSASDRIKGKVNIAAQRLMRPSTSSGFAYLLGKGCQSENFLVLLKKNANTGDLVEKGIIFDFFENMNEMECGEGYCSSTEFQHAFKIAMARIEEDVDMADDLINMHVEYITGSDNDCERSSNGQKQKKPRLPTNAVREILQLAGCDIPSPRGAIDFKKSTDSGHLKTRTLKSAGTDVDVTDFRVYINDREQAADEYINAKVNEFLVEIVRNTLAFTDHCRRIEAVPYDVAHALRLFAENGPNVWASGPKFVFDYSNDGEDVWVDNEDVNEEEDMNVTGSMIDDDNSSNDEYIDEDKYQEDNLINIFHAKYPPVFIEELTDKQFRKEILQPLFSGYWSMYMGFDIDEEDYEDEAPKDVVYWNPQPRDASVIINMLKRAMYAFIVALVREDFEQMMLASLNSQVALKDKQMAKEKKDADKEKEIIAKEMQTQIDSFRKSIPQLQTQVTAKDEALKEMAAKEVAMQAKIDSLQEQLKKFMPETVDLTSDTQLPQSQSGVEAAEEERPPKRFRPEGGRSTVEGPRTRSSIRQVQVKQENIKEGAIKCPDPDCDNIILLSEKGCNLVVCTKHKPHFLYFCAHCKIRPELFSESLGCDCPKRNTPQDRVMAQEMRNNRARENPEVLE
jgi:histone H3/H4